MSLIHYIFVRRDLPLGTLAAMVTHASGESGALYQDENGRFRGATAVVLEAKDEASLKKTSEYLECHGLRFVEVHESSEPYAGQLMAIGMVPTERTPTLSANLSSFQTLKSCLDNARSTSVELEPTTNEALETEQGS